VKEILIIEASPRSGFSTMAANQVATNLEKEFSVEVLALRDLNILPCKGCCACLFSGSAYCPHKNDDVKQVLHKIENADGVIIVVPNYSLQVTALLKQLFDRLAFVFHRPRLFGKTCLPIVVQGVYGGGKVSKYINEVFSFWGMKTVKGAVISGAVFVNRPQSPDVILKNQVAIDKAIARFLKELNNAKPKKPSLFQLMIFRSTRSSMKYFDEVLAPDKKYYESKGWYSSNYYYPVKLNLIDKFFGNLIDIMIRRMAKKT
jgi:multimeric flavodoxin WrbA